MNQLINHPDFGAIEVKTINNETWFCAKDVCDVLSVQNATQSLERLEQDEKLTYTLHRSGQNREMLFINESGLYALIIRSNKPVARKFRKWVTSEVLPAIRKYGTYSTDEKIMDKAIKRAEAKTVRNLLTTVDKNLLGTDKRLIAKQCLTDEFEVRQVLQGHKEDVHMMSLLYARATGNKKYRGYFYTLEGAENLLVELTKTKP
jgi:prophage antirepressor-like protein